MRLRVHHPNPPTDRRMLACLIYIWNFRQRLQDDEGKGREEEKEQQEQQGR